jgi:hypothetical protein
MPRLVTFYRVNLQDGITVEERPSGHYREDPMMGRTVFKNLRRAKPAFTEMVRAEIRRLQHLQKEVGPRTCRDDLKEHSFSAYAPPKKPSRGRSRRRQKA